MLQKNTPMIWVFLMFPEIKMLITIKISIE